jgi:AAA15 family ATPase/GTPase
LNDFSYSIYDHDPELLDSASEFIRSFDPMFETLEFVSRTQNDGTELRVAMTRHRGALYPVHFESGATERMLAILFGLYRTLNKGGMCVVDELDCKLHPLIVRKIVRMFHDRAQNKHRA